MRIGFDARYVRWDHHDGISRFSVGLSHELARLVSETTTHQLVMLISDDRQRVFLPDVECATVTSPTSAREPRVARLVNQLNLDVVFSPMQTMGSRGRKYRLVLAVHDLIYYRHRTPPPQFSWAIRVLWRLYHLTWIPQRVLLNRADAIVAVSQTTRDLISEHQLTKRPVFVVTNAANPIATTPAPEPQRKRIAVYMGSFMPYKNVETLVRAMAALPGWELHLLSRIDDRTRSTLESAGPAERLVFHNGTPEDVYVSLLASARALVSASRDEGFGIPLVEAMSLGTPVVVSDIPVFHEVGGAAALYADPDSPEAFAQHLTSLESPVTWNSKSRESRRQARQYSWGRSARELLRVLEAVNQGDTFHAS